MRYVQLPKRTTWHIVGRTYGRDTLTACDRKIPASARWLDDGSLADSEVCWTCLAGREWRTHATKLIDRRSVREYGEWYRATHPVVTRAPSPPVEAPCRKKCFHVWRTSLFDARLVKCATCGAVQKRATA